MSHAPSDVFNDENDFCYVKLKINGPIWTKGSMDQGRVTFSQTHKIGNNTINANFVFSFLGSFLHCLHHRMLVDVKLTVS